MNGRLNGSLRLVGAMTVLLGVTLVVNRLGVERIRDSVEQMGAWAPLGILSLRAVSIVFPAIPSTVYSLLAGALLGFGPGLGVIVIADLLACPLNFWIARRFGRQAVVRLVGQGWINQVDRLSQRHLENNTYLMTAFLMTGLFDFVCYAVGLTQTPWRKFLPALLLSVGLSDPPVVAIGAGIFSGGYLLLGVALIGVFLLSVITGWANRHRDQDPRSEPAQQALKSFAEQNPALNATPETPIQKIDP